MNALSAGSPLREPPDIRRDAGLARVVRTPAFAASIINIVVGAGIFTVPAALAASAGVYAPAAFVLCAIAIGAVTVCFAEAGSRVATSGGIYGFIDAAFGPRAGYVAGTLLWLGNVLACGSVVAALGDVAASVTSPAAAAATRLMVIVAVLAAVAAVNVAGVRRGATLINASVAIKLVPLLLFLVVGLFAVDPAQLSASARSGAPDPGRALILALFAFTGMESSLGASGEVVNPSRTIPRALATAMIVVTILYVAIQTVAQGLLGAALPQSAAPLADAIAQVSPPLRTVMLVGAALSMAGWVASDLLGTPRIVFALARDGGLPARLGRVHTRFRTPHVAIVTYAAAAGLLALTGTFAELAVLSTLAAAAYYIAGCIAAWLLARRGVALAGEPLNVRGLGVAATVGVVAMSVLIALASAAEILGLVAVMATSAAVHVLLAART